MLVGLTDSIGWIGSIGWENPRIRKKNQGLEETKERRKASA